MVGRKVRLLLLMARDFERNFGLLASSAKRVFRGELDLAAGFTKLLCGFPKGDGPAQNLQRGFGLHLYRSGLLDCNSKPIPTALERLSG